VIASIEYMWMCPLLNGNVVFYAKSGVGYEVLIPNGIEFKTENGTVYIHHHITDRGQTLYGFGDWDGLFLFRDLISVNGVGPSAALKLMGDYTLEKIRIDIADGDAMDLAKAKGIGKKTAESIVSKLKEKYKECTSKKAPTIDHDYCRTDIIRNYNEVAESAVRGLIKLGIKRKDAEANIAKIYMSVYESLKNDPETIGYVDPDAFLKALIKGALNA
jgi:Holliday junction DNA helicase RuvA